MSVSSLMHIKFKVRSDDIAFRTSLVPRPYPEEGTSAYIAEHCIPAKVLIRENRRCDC